jgi:hypothetical protein
LSFDAARGRFGRSGAVHASVAARLVARIGGIMQYSMPHSVTSWLHRLTGSAKPLRPLTFRDRGPGRSSHPTD